MTEDEYRKLRERVDLSRSKAEQAKGSLETLMQQLKEEFECDTLEEAQTLVKDLEKKAARAEKALEQAVATYEAKWKKE